jgi:heptosyltransferase-1
VVLAAQALEEPAAGGAGVIGDGARHILLVKLSSIGDVVHALPVAAALRRRFPEAYLAWAVRPAAAEVVVGNPHLNETLIVGGRGEESPGVRHVPEVTRLRALRRVLHGIGFDLALDVQGLFKSALLAYLSGAKERVGFLNCQEGTCLLNNRRVVPDRRDCHAVEGYLGFAAAVGAPTEPVEFSIATSAEDEQYATQLLGEGRFLALIPGARWASKRWPPARFAAVCDALHAEYDCEGLVVGGAGDGTLAAEILAAAKSPVLDLTGKTTLKQLAAVFRRCALTVANDTGPMYISSALGTPTVAVFGPTDSTRLGPYGKGHAKVSAGADCAPCRRRNCSPRKCLEAVTVEQVVEAARPLFTREGGRG